MTGSLASFQTGIGRSHGSDRCRGELSPRRASVTDRSQTHESAPMPVWNEAQ